MGIPIGSNLDQGVYHPETKHTSGGPKPPAPLSPAAALAEHIAMQTGQTPQQVAPTLTPENEPVYGFEDGGRNRMLIMQNAQIDPLYSILNNYLRKKGSPLAGRGKMIVQAGKNAGVDPRLLVAITGAETSFMTNPNAAPMSEHNAFGMGPGIKYPNWRAGFNAAAQNLGQNYFRQGYDTINEISGKWAPVGAANDPNHVNENWAGNVGQYYKELGGKRPDIGAIPKWGGVQELIYDPKGYWFRGQKGVTPETYGGHDTHIHLASTNPRALLKAYRVGTKHGLTFGENPYEGGQVYPVHAGTSQQYGDTSGSGNPSFHYQTFAGRFGPDKSKLGEAFDITDPNANKGWDLARFFDFLAPRVVGAENYSYGTTGGGGYNVTGPATHSQAVAARQQTKAANDLLGSSLASYEVMGGGRRKKRKSTVDDLIANLQNIQTGGSYLGA